MPFTYLELVEQFLTNRRTLSFETEEFLDLRHDRDLVPGINSRLDRVSQAYGYFTALTYETQGVNDVGSDVTVRYRDLAESRGALQHIVGFQIKSHEELKNKDCLHILKAQRDDAFRKLPGLIHYFIILCGYEKPIRKRLNAIQAEFIGAIATTVVVPTQALRFLRYESYQIDAQVKRLLSEDDVVIRELQYCLYLPSDTAKALACYLAVRLLVTGSDTERISDLLRGPLAPLYDRLIDRAIAREERLERLREERRAGKIKHDDSEDDYESEEEDAFEDDEYFDEESTLGITSTDPDELLAFDLEYLSEVLIRVSSHDSTVSLNLSAAKPVIAVAADAMVRFGYGMTDVLPYLLDLAGVDV